MRLERKGANMSIITISRGSYSRGKEVAEGVARTLGYECISRDVLLEASAKFGASEFKLVRALHDAPSLLERFSHGKAKYVAYIRAALLKRLRNDNVVYHGLAGHYFVRGVPHVLKVRIIADMEDRVREEMKRERISEDDARKLLVKDDEERRKWGLHLYGIDTRDPSLYDLTLHIRKLSVDDVVGIIVRTVSFPHFKTTPESQQMLNDLCLEAEVEAAIVDEFPRAVVRADDGIVTVIAEGSIEATEKIFQHVRTCAEGVQGIRELNVDVNPAGYED
jgi:cytidylate kinase